MKFASRHSAKSRVARLCGLAVTCALLSPVCVQAHATKTTPDERALLARTRSVVLGAPSTIAARHAPVPAAQWKKPVVYAAATSRGVVNVYRDGKTPPKKSLFSFALFPGVENSLVVDTQGNLFFADTYSTWVYEYAPKSETARKGFPTTQPPWQIALRGKTLYAFLAAPSGGDAGVAVYENGKTKPARFLTDPAVVYPQGLAVDAAGNVFVAYGGTNLGEYGVGEFIGGAMPMVPLDISQDIFPVALAIDPAGNLLVDAPDDSERTSTVYIFPPGQTEPANSIAGLPNLYQLSFTADGSSFYTGDVADHAFAKYSYPDGKLIFRFKDSDAKWGFAGIAPSPAAPVGTWAAP